MKQRQVALGLAFSIAGLVFSFFLQWMVLGAVCACCAAYFIFQLYREQQKTLDSIREETIRTDAQLRKELIEVHRLACTKLVGADLALIDRVANLLRDASVRLGSAPKEHGILYPANYVVLWNMQGLELVAQARQLIDGYTPVGV
jgi:hypothetical protein